MKIKSIDEQDYNIFLTIMDNVLHQGWLEKEGSIIRTWKKRWVVLRTNIIEYFDDEHQSIKKGAFAIDSSLRIESNPENFVISLITKFRLFKVRTRDEIFFRVWLSAFQKLTDEFDSGRSKSMEKKRSVSDSGFIYEINDKADILKEGWLEKLGFIVPNWKRRWIVLRSNNIEYYENEKMNQRKGIFFLDSSMRIFISSTPDSCRFCVTTNTRSMEFTATSKNDLESWLNILFQIANQKSTIGAYICRVKNDNDFKHVLEWENQILEGNSDFDQCKFFCSFNQWQDTFEPGVRQKKERQEEKKIRIAEKLAKKKAAEKNRSPSILDRLKGHIVASIIRDISKVSKDKISKTIVEGIGQFFALSFSLISFVYSGRIKEEKDINKVESVKKEINQFSNKVDDSKDFNISNVMALDFDFSVFDKIPTEFMEHLLILVNGLQALAFSYRFEKPNNSNKIGICRRLAIHGISEQLFLIYNLMEKDILSAKTMLEDVMDHTINMNQKLTSVVNEVQTEIDNIPSPITKGNEIGKEINTLIHQEENLKDQLKDIREDPDKITRKVSMKLKEILRTVINKDNFRVQSSSVLQRFTGNSNGDSESIANELISALENVIYDFVDKQLKIVEDKILNEIENLILFIAKRKSELHKLNNATKSAEIHNQKLLTLGENLNKDIKLSGTRNYQYTKYFEDSFILDDELENHAHNAWNQLQNTIEECVSGGLGALAALALNYQTSSGENNDEEEEDELPTGDLNVE